MTTPESLVDERALLEALLVERFGRRPRRFFSSPAPADTRECPFSLPRTLRDSPGVLGDSANSVTHI